MTTNPKIVSFIKPLREKHPRLEKKKIYPLLVSFCKEKEITSIKKSTIGKVIKRNNLFHQNQERIYHNPNSNYAGNRRKIKRLRVEHSPRPKNFGYIQIDTVIKFVNGVRYYFYSTIDTKGKFALFLPYKHLNSRNIVDFFKKLVFTTPFIIKTVQINNGLVERYNRSIQKEFINSNLHFLYNSREFSTKLTNYLLFYNQERVHLFTKQYDTPKVSRQRG